MSTEITYAPDPEIGNQRRLARFRQRIQNDPQHQWRYAGLTRIIREYRQQFWQRQFEDSKYEWEQ